MKRSLLYLAVSTAGLAWGCADTPTVAPPAPVRDPLVPAVQPSFAIGGGGPTGAIFTTVPDGSIVNENVRYRDKREVYLDGGPRGGSPQTAAGLDDGDYVFQITDPSGAYLLSQDKSACRLIRVRNGVIVKLLDRNPTTGALTEHDHTDANDACHVNNAPTPPTEAQKTDFGSDGRHDTNRDVDYGAATANAIVVQMMPYANTPNPGGVYKAWISKIDEYAAKATGKGVRDPFEEPLVPKRGKDAQPCSQGCYQPDPGFGPPRNFQKTDNFKVQEEARLRVVKVHDANGDGVRNDGEQTLEGWDVAFVRTQKLYDGTDDVIFDQTTATRTFVPGEQVIVCEADQAGWVFSFATGGTPVTTPSVLATDTKVWHCLLVTVGASGSTVEIAFGNYQPARKRGTKWHDLNANGTRDAGDVGLKDWRITLVGKDNKGNAVSRYADTQADGSYDFTGINPGKYLVCERLQSGWYQSFPKAGTEADCSGTAGNGPRGYSITLNSGDDDTGNDFGNYTTGTKSGTKFFDALGDGTNLKPLGGITIEIFGGPSGPFTQQTASDGSYKFSGLLPGTYITCEILAPDLVSAPDYTQTPNGYTYAGCSDWDAAHGHRHGPAGYKFVLASQQDHTGNDFCNTVKCDGLSPGFWTNWRNHYTSAQFLLLLQTTIADKAGFTDAQKIAAADGYLGSTGCDDGDAINCMRRMLLADQLTVRLTTLIATTHPALPNPSGGNLKGICLAANVTGTLKDVFARALAIHDANGAGYTRDQILAAKNDLAAFITK